MKNFKIFIGLFFFAVLFFSCTKDAVANDDDVCAEELLALSEVYQTKTQAYVANMSAVNCNALKTSFNNFYNKASQCNALTDDLRTARQSLNSLDCATGGTGGGTTGSAMVWVQSDLGCGTITVNIDGLSRTVTSYYGSGAPACGSSGCANFTLNPGTYTVTASCQSKSWNTSITVSVNGCATLKLIN